MDKKNLIDRCISLIEGGYAEAMEEAVAKIESNLVVKAEPDAPAVDHDELNQTPASPAPHFGFITGAEPTHNASVHPDIQAMVKAIPCNEKAWSVIVMPTIYGTTALVRSCNLPGEINSFANCTPDSMHFCPVIIEKGNIVCDVDGTAENADALLVWFSEDDTPMSWTPANQPEDRKIRYVIPIDANEVIAANGFGGVACSDIYEAIAAVRGMDDREQLDFQMPEIGWKITKPGMQCRDVQYALGEWYKYEGAEPIALHKRGCHYATDPQALRSWYRPYDDNNEVYLVQAGPNCIKGSDRAVTDRILFLERVQWDEV